MRGKTKNKIARVFTFVLVILVLVLAIGAIVKFTTLNDELTDLFDPTFRVKYCGDTYTGTDNKISLPKGEQARFDVKSVNGYSVSVLPNVTPSTDFTYTVDGVSYKFSETNLTKAFLSQSNVQSGFFKLNAMDDYSIESVLSKLYEGKTVVVLNGVANPYVLSVTSGDSTINFVICLTASRITLDTEHILF